MSSSVEIQQFVAAARRYVATVLGADTAAALDGSEESLAYLDHYVTRVRSDGKGALRPDTLALVAPALGAYLGQVALGRFGGRWLLAGDDPAGWRVELEPAPLRFSPVGIAAVALAGDEVEGYDASLATSDALAEPLAEALAALPPVDAAYFYSLTGRFETLAHALELLVALERRRRAATPSQ